MRDRRVAVGEGRTFSFSWLSSIRVPGSPSCSSFANHSNGTSVGDSDDEEHKHHFSIDTHVLHADHAGKHLKVIKVTTLEDALNVLRGLGGDFSKVPNPPPKTYTSP